MVSEHIKEIEREVWSKFNEYFPEGKLPFDRESTLRSKALVILIMAKEVGVQGHAYHIKLKKPNAKEKKKGKEIIRRYEVGLF